VCIYHRVRFEWDPDKARVNRAKHGIELADAIEVLFDPLGLTMADEHADELRWVTVGFDCVGRVLVVVYSRNRGVVRLLSARQATRRERRAFEEER